MVSSLTISTCGSRSKAGWYQNTDHQRSVTDPRKDCKARRAEHLNTASAQSLITDSKTVIPYSKPWFTSARSHEARAVASGDFALPLLAVRPDLPRVRPGISRKANSRSSQFVGARRAFPI